VPRVAEPFIGERIAERGVQGRLQPIDRALDTTSAASDEPQHEEEQRQASAGCHGR